MTVIQPNSITGINSITVQTGQALNIHDASGNLIRNITSSTGISTFASINVTQGSGDLTVGVSTFFVDNSATNVGVGTNVPYNNAGTNVHIHSANTTSEIRFTNSTTGGGNNGGTIQQGGNTLYVSNSEAGNIAFENNGSERVRITSDGDVIMNRSGNDLASAHSANGLYIVDDDSNYTGLAVANTGSGDANIYLDASNGDLSGGDYCMVAQNNDLDMVFRNNESSSDIIFQTGGTTERLRVTSAGSVGIASTNPDRSLTVYKDAVARINIKSLNNSNTGIEFGDQNDQNAGYITYDNTDNSFAVGLNGTGEKVSIDSNGNVSLASSVTVTGVCTAAAFIPSQGQLSNRNLIINGAFQVAQYGSSSTSAGYKTVDRWSGSLNDVDEAPTFAQHDLTSSDTGPWAAGFRYSYHLTNGNQTGGAGSVDKIEISTALEAQDIANSGWDYTSTSSYITLSFWVRSSVAQNFYGHFKTTDGTSYNYPFETGSLSADTWTKVTKTIPGNSNLQFDNNTDAGLTLLLYGFMGTGLTGSVSLDTWAAYVSSTRTPDQTSTWYTTNDSTLEITGVQLEVGQAATPFEHKNYGDELSRCQRYYQRYREGNAISLGLGFGYSANELDIPISFITPMRTAPSIDQNVSTSGYVGIEGSGIGGSQYVNANFSLQFASTHGCNIYADPDPTLTVGAPYHCVLRNAAAYVAFNAEL